MIARATTAGPAISVVIPSYNRMQELRTCLEGFAKQTVRGEQFEVIVIDDGSTCDMRSLAEDFTGTLDLEILRIAHAGPGAARNAGLERARGPLLILWDDDQRPSPDLVEYCLNFHDRHSSEEEASLLYFELDPVHSASSFARWAFGLLYGFPSSACVSGWARFWSGAVTCKKSLFRHGQFNPAYQMLEDAELGVRLSQRVDLQVYFEPRPTGTFTRLPTFEQMWRRQYMLAYFSHEFARQYRRVVDLSFPPYNAPERYVIRDLEKLAAVHAFAAAAASNNGASPVPSMSRLATASWNTLDMHVRAEAWLDARDERTATPPGSIACLTKYARAIKAG